jgi:polysaccharide export outer membrane protein
MMDSSKAKASGARRRHHARRPVRLDAGLLAILIATVWSAAIGCAAEVAGTTGRSGYLIRPDDVVSVKVFQEDDLLTEARVSARGSIKMPLIGDVVISGKSADAAARVIEEALAKKFLVDPQVSLSVVAYAKRSFTVLGEVQKPGVYDIPDLQEITLLTAIGYGNGYTKMADPAHIRVKRFIDHKWVTYKLNGSSMGQESAPFKIEPDDVIIVGERLL